MDYLESLKYKLIYLDEEDILLFEEEVYNICLLKRKEDLPNLLSLFRVNKEQDTMLFSLIHYIEMYIDFFGFEFYLQSVLDCIVYEEEWLDYHFYIIRRISNNKNYNSLLWYALKKTEGERKKRLDKFTEEYNLFFEK